MIYLEFQEGTSNKFWKIEVNGNTFTVTFGKVGTAGKSQQKNFDSPEEAQKEADKLVASKRKKGYIDVGKDISVNDMQQIETRERQLNLLIKKIEEFVDNQSSETLRYYPYALQTIMGDINDENDLYNLIIQYPKLRPNVLRVFDALMISFGKRNILWVDDETQAGLSLATHFALANKYDVPMLTRFINFCDIDHASRIYERIVSIWNQWGFCQETCDLIVSFMIRDQNGEYLPEKLNEQELSITSLIQKNENANILLASIRNWLDGDSLQAKNYRRNENILNEDEFIETLTPLFASLFKIDTVEAEESAEKYVQLYVAGKVPKINQIYKKPEAPLQKGTKEQLFADIMGSMDDLGWKVYEKSRKKGLKLNLESKIGIGKPDPTRSCIIRIDGQKYNKIMHYVNGNVGDNWVTKKFEGMDYSGVPDSFFKENLFPALLKWTENKIDTQAYLNLYGDQVNICLAVSETGMGWIEEVVDRHDKLKEWQTVFLTSVKNSEFTKWTCKEFGADVNFWLIFAWIDQLGSDIVVEFLSVINSHLKKEHQDSRTCIQNDILPYIEAYYETLKKEDTGHKQAKDFLKILPEANAFYKLSKGKNLPFNKKAKAFAEEILSR